MMPRAEWVEARREEGWHLGIQHREALLRQYMNQRGLTERPFLKDVVDDLIEEIQGARLREEVLPLDRFAQVEAVGDRVVVTINCRIGDIPGVKDAAGVAHVAKWHESIHVEHHVHRNTARTEPRQLALPGVERPQLIVCRRIPSAPDEIAGREFLAEAGGVAAAIAGPDLLRCPAFGEFQRRATSGGNLGPRGWQLLGETAVCIGVNRTALARYLNQRRFFRVESDDMGKRWLIANAQLFGCVKWL